MAVEGGGVGVGEGGETEVGALLLDGGVDVAGGGMENGGGAEGVGHWFRWSHTPWSSFVGLVGYSRGGGGRWLTIGGGERNGGLGDDFLHGQRYPGFTFDKDVMGVAGGFSGRRRSLFGRLTPTPTSTIARGELEGGGRLMETFGGCAQ